MEKSKLLDRVSGEERMVLAMVLDKAEQARTRSVPVSTDFMSPQLQEQAKELLYRAGVSEGDYVALGGFQAAERRVLLFLPDWLEPEYAEAESPICAIRARFRAEDGLTHRDLLGSLMSLGVVREKLGDLLVGEESADVLCLQSVRDYLLTNWETAGRTHLKLQAVELSALHIPQASFKELRDTVSSLRLDAVAAAGFRLSRGKAAELVESGKLELNWRSCQKPNRLLEAGDRVSARGFGKFELTEVGGLTRKGRVAITIKRFE